MDKKSVHAWGWRFLTALEVIILAVIFIRYASYEWETAYDGTELETAKDGLWIGTPPREMHKGVYDITAEIISDATEEGEVTVCLKTDKGIRNDKISLYQSDDGRMEYRAYITKNGAEASFGADVSRTGLVQIKSVHMKYLRKASSFIALIRWAVCFCAADLLAFFVLGWMRGRKNEEAIKAIFFYGIIGFLVSIPLIGRGLSFSHDLLFHLNRIYGISQGISTQFPVRIQPFWMNGYGYAVGVCYGDLLLYIPALFYMAGFPLEVVYKGYLFFINLLTLGFSSKSFGIIANDRKIGRFCGILYTASVWRMIDVYTRGALGEYSAMAFLPLIVLGVWFLLKEEAEEKRGILCLILGFTGVIQTHVLTSIMVCLFVALWVILEARRFFRGKVLRAFILAAAGVLLLNAGLLVPLADYYINVPMEISGEMKGWIQGDGANVKDLFALKTYPTAWSAKYTVDGRMSMTLGAALVIVFLLACLFWILGIRKKRKDAEKQYLGNIFLLAGLALFMATRYFPYDFLYQNVKSVFKLIGAVQFPWRYLTMAQVYCVMLAAMMLAGLKKTVSGKYVRMVRMGCVGLGIVALVHSVSFQTEFVKQANSMDFLGTNSLNSFMFAIEYRIRGTSLEALNDAAIYSSEGVWVGNAVRTGMTFQMDVNADDQGGYVDLPVLAYKGYQARGANGVRLEVGSGSNNRLRILFPGALQGTVRTYFAEPWYWRLAELVSVAFLCFFLWKIRSDLL